MSPEQINNRRSGIDHPTDIYSLGVTLYELLTLKLPFDSANTQEVFRKITLKDPVDPRRLRPGIPRDLAAICLMAMEKRREHRYATMGDMARDLRRFLEGRPVFAKPAGDVTKAIKRVRRNPLVSAALGVALLALVVSTLVILFLFYPQVVEERDNAQAQGHLLQSLEALNSNPALAMSELTTMQTEVPVRAALFRYIKSLVIYAIYFYISDSTVPQIAHQRVFSS